MLKAKTAFKNSYRECRRFGKTSPLNILYSVVMDYLIHNGKSKRILKVIKKINIDKNPLLSYYSSRVHFLSGYDHEAVSILTRLIEKYPNHADVSYLLSDALASDGKKDAARDVLETTLENSSRLKTWLLLANLVETDNDYQRLKEIWTEYKKEKKTPEYHYSVDSYISTAAMRSQNYDDAIALWQSFILKTINKESIFPSDNGIKRFSSNSGAKALLDLNEILNSAGIEFFLVSGTLLGCIREGKLLSHDKDIDVGIWSDVQIEKVILALKKSGVFYIQASRSNLALRVKHVNGTAIDIFLHFREKNNYWHGGSKLKWNNTPFSLTEHTFLNRIFLIPENYDLYLSENYGNWRVKKTDFDSAFDTTNANTINKSELLVHTYKEIASTIHANDREKMRSHLNSLQHIGEEKFYLKLINLLG